MKEPRLAVVVHAFTVALTSRSGFTCFRSVHALDSAHCRALEISIALHHCLEESLGPVPIFPLFEWPRLRRGYRRY